MSHPGLETYVAFECARLERSLDPRGQIARAEYRRLAAAAAPRRVRLSSWLGLKLVQAGTWLCDRSATKGYTDGCTTSLGQAQKG